MILLKEVIAKIVVQKRATNPRIAANDHLIFQLSPEKTNKKCMTDKIANQIPSSPRQLQGIPHGKTLIDGLISCIHGPIISIKNKSTNDAPATALFKLIPDNKKTYTNNNDKPKTTIWFKGLFLASSKRLTCSMKKASILLPIIQSQKQGLRLAESCLVFHLPHRLNLAEWLIFSCRQLSYLKRPDPNQR